MILWYVCLRRCPLVSVVFMCTYPIEKLRGRSWIEGYKNNTMVLAFSVIIRVPLVFFVTMQTKIGLSEGNECYKDA